MGEITLEKIDKVRERTGSSYSEANEALEASDGNVVDAIIYLEKNKKNAFENVYTTKDEFLNFLKELINKGNITRIKVKKEEKVLVDMPVNAGIAVGVVAYAIWAPLIAIGVIGAVVTNVTIEITKKDGSVEVVNKIIKTTMQDVKDKVSDVASEVKEKVSDVKDRFTGKNNDASSQGSETPKESETVYTYTVKFDDNENTDKN